MLYRNDNIIINDEKVTGSIKDLKEYFRYEIASQCLTGEDCDYENFKDNVKNIIELLDNLYEDTENEIFTNNDIMTVSVHPMGGFVIEREGF